MDRRSASLRLEPRRRAPPEATLRIGATLAVPDVLRSLGANPAHVLGEAGFDLALFDNPDNVLTLAARGRLLQHCVERTGCEHFGLLVGQHAGLHSLGLMGLLAKYSPDVGAALRTLVRFFHHHVRGAAMHLEVDRQLAILEYAIHQSGTVATDQVGDGALAGFTNVMQSLCGIEWKPSLVTFAHRKPRDIEPYREFFRAPLRFEAEQYSIIFLASWLPYQLPQNDPELRRALMEQIAILEARHRDEFPEQVRSVLRSALLTDHNSVEDIAALFSMHSRTLNRRLNEFGISFKDLADEGRYEIARQTLTDTELEVRDVAALLNYAGASAFVRAFRRWSGTTPAKWRKNGRRGMRSRR
jgi:AraC-like DNA-binding protein